MADIYLDLLDNLTDAINAAAITGCPTAVVRFNPKEATENIPDDGVLFVTTPPDAIAEDLFDSDAVAATLRAYIILIVPGTHDETDARAGLALLRSIGDALRGLDIAGDQATYTWVGSTVPVPLDIEKLQDDRQYFGVLNMTYQVGITLD